MNSRMCKEFQNWLERLPRQELSPSFKRHLGVCDRCRLMHQKLDSVASALAAVKPPENISEQKLEDLVELAKKTTLRHRNRRHTLRLCMTSIFSLPFVALINWLWASLGYNFIAANVSPFLAKAFLAFFGVSTIGLIGGLYIAIILIVAWVRGHQAREITA